MARILSTGSVEPSRGWGFTLVEILVVLAIAVSMAAVLGMSAFRRAPSVADLAGELARDIRVLRSQAIIRGELQQLVIDLEHNRFLFPDHESVLPKTLGIRVTGAERLRLGSQLIAVEFYEDGSSSGALISLSDREQRHELSINWISGRVSLHDPGYAAREVSGG
jgi:general secretion pathway protein H